MLDGVDPAFDDVAALVIGGVEGRWSATVGAASLAVDNLVGRLGDDRGDTAGTQMAADRTRGIRLVPTEPLRAGAGTTATTAGHPQMGHQHRQHRRVTGLTRSDQDHQRQTGTINEWMDLGAQTASGAAYSMISRLDAQIRVIRQTPLCDAPG